MQQRCRGEHWREKRPGGTPCRRGSGVGGEGSRSRRGVHDGWRAAISSARRDSTSAGMDAWMLSRARAHSSYRTESAHLVCRCVCAHTCPMPVEPSASQHAMDHACGLTILRSTMDERGNGDSYAMIQKRKCKPDATVSLEGSNAVRTVT